MMSPGKNPGEVLAQYVNRAGGSRAACTIGSLWSVPGLAFDGQRIRSDLLRDSGEGSFGERHETIGIPPYEGNNAHVLRMRSYLADNVQRDILGAYVHGSLATGDVTGFSDFDALVIVRNETLLHAPRFIRMARHLYRAQSIMYDHDPLQHHGWFVLVERQLKNFPSLYFPPAILRHARSIGPDDGKSLDLIAHSVETVESIALLSRAVESVNKQLSEDRIPQDSYSFKVLLSRFMMLPALYVQARDRSGCYKRDSFPKARADFDPDTWAIMDRVSSIRQAWNVPVVGMVQKVLSSPRHAVRRYASHVAPSIPAHFRDVLSREGRKAMKVLGECMLDRLSKH